MQMRAGGTARGAHITNHVAPLNRRSLGSSEFRQMQIHGENSLPVIDAHRVAMQVPAFDESDHAVRHGMNRRSGGASLVEAAMKIAGRFAILKAAHAEWRSKAIGNREFKRLRPIARLGNRLAKSRAQVRFSGRERKPGDLLAHDDILDRIMRVGDCYRGSLLHRSGGIQKLQLVLARPLFYRNRHEPEQTTFRRRK